MFNTNYIDQKGKINNDKTQINTQQAKNHKVPQHTKPKTREVNGPTQVNLKETYMISVFGIMLTKIFFERLEVSKKNYSVILLKCSFYKQFHSISMGFIKKIF
jgi:hypothetical protein